MKKQVVNFLIFCCMFLLLNSTTNAEEPEKTEKVIATGVGVDADKARANAIRNAVEQVMGTYVSSDTIVKNNQLLKDEILSYSGGYLKDSRVINQEKTEDGLFSVKLEAQVVSTKLKRKIEDLNITTRTVAGESLFGEAFSKIEQKKGGAELLGKILSKYPQAAYKFEVGKPAIESTNHTSDKVTILVPLVVRWDAAYLAELKSVLSQAATKEFSSVSIESFKKGSNRDIAQENQIVCFSTHATKRSGRANSCYVLDKALTSEEYAASPTEVSKGKKVKRVRGRSSESTLLHLPNQAKELSLFLSFKGADGGNITSETYHFTKNDDYRKRPSERQPGMVSSFLKGVLGDNGDPDSGEVAPKKSKKRPSHSNSTNSEYGDRQTHNLIEENTYWFYPPGILWLGRETSHLMLIEDAAFRMDVTVPVDVEQLKNVTKIEVMMNGFE